MQVRSLICQKVRHREIAQRNSNLEPGKLEPFAPSLCSHATHSSTWQKTAGEDSNPPS